MEGANFIDERGFWVGRVDDIAQHFFDPSLAQGLLSYLKEEECRNVVDLGCGLGEYATFLKEGGIQCACFDGNPNTPEITDRCCGVLDLSKYHGPMFHFDWVLSLEVGEHIPKEYESNFINNLHNFSTKGVILSWAVKGQGGDGHVNCQNNEYIKDIFEKKGYSNDVDAEIELRRVSQISWFKNTIMVFKK